MRVHVYLIDGKVGGGLAAEGFLVLFVLVFWGSYMYVYGKDRDDRRGGFRVVGDDDDGDDDG